MPSGGKVEYFGGAAAAITYKVPAATTVVGGRLVMSNGVTREAITATADAVNVLGYAQYDADGDAESTQEQYVAVRSDGVWPCVATGAVNAGDFVKAGAAGTVVAVAADGDPRLIVGQAVADIAGAAEGPIRLMLG
jgi:hypothetical protein